MFLIVLVVESMKITESGAMLLSMCYICTQNPQGESDDLKNEKKKICIY